MSRCRPVSSVASIQHFALVGRGDLELLAVFRDRAARQDQALALKDADDLGIAQRLARVFVLDDLPDPLLDRDRRHAFAERAADPAVEEVLHLEHALRRVHVLVGDDAADGRFVHADVVGHVAQDERAEMFDALIQEVALEVDDAVGDLVDRLLALLDRFDQPERRAELVLHVRPGFVAVVRALVQQTPVDGADPHLRQAVFVQHRDILILDLDHIHVGDDVLRLRRVVTAARLRVQMPDDFDVFLQVVDRQPQLAGDLGNLVVLEKPQVVGNDLFRRRAFEAQMSQLEQQTFLQVP